MSATASADGDNLQHFETQHPYQDNLKLKKIIHIENAASLFLTFDPRCKTEANYDKFILTVPESDFKKVFSGANFPKGSLEVPGNTVVLTMTSDAGGNDWGVAVSIKGTEAIDINSEFMFAGTKYGGVGRSWFYGKQAPRDLAWMPQIVDPVLHDSLTTDPEKGRGKIKWKVWDIDSEKVKADQTLFLLPSKKIKTSDLEVTMLMLLPKKNVWKIVKVNKLYHYMEVYTMDVFGRRGYPKISYTSDYRMTLGTLRVNTEETLFPHSSITRFESGNIESNVIGGEDVVITEQNEGADGLGPRMFLPGRVTNGILPGALSEVFDLYELQSNGEWVGKNRKMWRQTEKGTMVPFVDAFYDYELEVRSVHADTTNAVVRRDVDPVTLAVSGRRLISLTTSNDAASLEIVRLLTQIESISHILAWSAPVENYEEAFSDQHLIPAVVDLPRLRVKFSVSRLDDGTIRLYVVDSGGKYVMKNQVDSGVNPTLVAGIPSHLLLTSNESSIHLLVPNCPMVRPKVSFCPFTTCTVNDMDNMIWQYSCNARYYMYEVHPSDTFVSFTSIGATLYWAFLKLLHREYVDAFAAIVSCGTDMPLQWSEHTMLSYFAACDDDHHPDAHACRLKLRLALQHSPIFQWPTVQDKKGDASPLCEQFGSYLTKRTHVNLACRLTQNEEIILMDYIDEKELSGDQPDPSRATRRDLIELVQGRRGGGGGGGAGAGGGETKASDADASKHQVYYYTQSNGGYKYNEKALSLTREGVAIMNKFKDRLVWISRMDVTPESYSATLTGSNALSFVDCMWDLKLEGGAIAAIQAMMAGNVSTAITKVGTSSPSISTQYMAHMLTRFLHYKGEGAAKAKDLLLFTTLDWKQQSPLKGNFKDFKDLCSGGMTNFQCYINKETGDEPGCAWRKQYLLPHAELISKQSLTSITQRLGYHVIGSSAEGQNLVCDKAKEISLEDTADEIPGTTNYARPMTSLKVVSNMGPASVSSEDISAFMKQPISQFVQFDDYVTFQAMPNNELCPDTPPVSFFLFFF